VNIGSNIFAVLISMASQTQALGFEFLAAATVSVGAIATSAKAPSGDRNAQAMAWRFETRDRVSWCSVRIVLKFKNTGPAKAALLCV
jgi:hypothetical protein